MDTSTDPVLLADPRVAAIPVRESGEPLVALGPRFGPAEVERLTSRYVAPLAVASHVAGADGARVAA